VSFISGNYVTGDFIQLLKSNEFDCSRSAHFIWEGNTMTAAKLGAVQGSVIVVVGE